MVSGRAGSMRAKVIAVLESRLSQCGPDESRELSSRLREVRGEIQNWKRAVAEGVNLQMAVGELNKLAEHEGTLESALEKARQRERLDVDIDRAAKEVVGQIERLPEVLARGSVAEVKSVLRGFIATIEYNPETRKARVGFYPLERTEPARAILGFRAPESARISMVAGARFRADSERVPVVTARWLYAGVGQGTREMVRVGLAA